MDEMKQLRNTLGLSQVEMAELLRITRGQLKKAYKTHSVEFVGSRDVFDGFRLYGQ